MSGDRPSVETYCDRFSDGFCDVLSPCCPLDEDTCRSSMKAYCMAGDSTASESGLAFDASAADECVASIPQFFQDCEHRAADAPEYKEAQAVCNAVWRGASPTGTTCTSDGSCAPVQGAGVVCAQQPDGARVCASVPYLDAGDECEDVLAGVCAQDLYCNGAASPPSCQPLKPVDSPCSESAECATGWCEDERTCQQVRLAQTCAIAGA